MKGNCSHINAEKYIFILTQTAPPLSPSRDHLHRALRLPLGGGLVAGLPHSRGSDSPVGHPLLVPSALPAHRAEGRSTVHPGADQLHQRPHPAGAQVPRRRANRVPGDGQRYGGYGKFCILYCIYMFFL